MPIPTRPTDGAPTATDWGQAVHDYTFSPVGTNVLGAYTSIGGTEARLDLSSVEDDPGGYLDAANDQVEIPADGDGLYGISARAMIDETSDPFRIRMYLNGAVINTTNGTGEGSTAVNVPFATQYHLLAEGDVIHFTAQRISGSGSGQVRVLDLFLIRLGAELGAP